MKILRFLFLFALAGVAFVSVIPHLFPNFWLTDIFSHFKLQYLILLFLLLFPAALIFTKKRIFPVVLILVLIVWNSWFILPLYFQDSDTEFSGETLSILSLNLLASNTNYIEALELIREKDPDVVVLLELSEQWEEQMQVLNAQYPYRKMHAQTNNFGIGFLSKKPLISSIIDFGKGFPPSILSKIEISGREITLLATHPFPPVNRDKFEIRNHQLQEIAKLSKSQSDFILIGDLNTSSYSWHFQELLEDGDLKDSRKGFGIASSWPTDLYLLRTTLDHFLFKGEIQVLKRTTERNIGSDHLPVFLEVGFQDRARLSRIK